MVDDVIETKIIEKMKIFKNSFFKGIFFSRLYTVNVVCSGLAKEWL